MTSIKQVSCDIKDKNTVTYFIIWLLYLLVFYCFMLTIYFYTSQIMGTNFNNIGASSYWFVTSSVLYILMFHHPIKVSFSWKCLWFLFLLCVMLVLVKLINTFRVFFNSMTGLITHLNWWSLCTLHLKGACNNIKFSINYISCVILYSSLKPDAHVNQWTGSSVAQVMICHLFSTDTFT